jgi:hypothetical protein
MTRCLLEQFQPKTRLLKKKIPGAIYSWQTHEKMRLIVLNKNMHLILPLFDE